MARHTLPATLLLTALLAPVAGALPLDGTDDEPLPSGSGFLVTPGRHAVLDFVVPSHGRVSMVVHIQAGTAADLQVEGPGACVVDGPVVAAGPGKPQAMEIDCGFLYPMNIQIGLGTTAGVVRGHVEARGAQSI
ncbi:MAG: hypothetical protein ACYC2H_09660 [Thermoplasmatota archaeon]